MKNLFRTLLVVAVVATLATACKKGEDHGTEGGHSTNETTQQNGVALDQNTTPAGDTVTTPSDTNSQPAVSTTEPATKN